jgi:hypothetical protein
MSRNTRIYRYDFRGHQAFPVTASGAGTPWTLADTSAAGAPTAGGLTGGGYRLGFAANSEVENLCLYFGDVLAFDIDELIRFSIICKTVASLTATGSIAFGLGSARNDTITSITNCALFRLINDNNVVIRTTDGTTTKNSIATGLTLKDTWKRFEMNFAERNTTVDPPSVSLGRKSNIGFYGANDNGSVRRVASGTRFDMTACTTGLQPMIQLQRTADTDLDTFDVLEIEVEVNLPNYN